MADATKWHPGTKLLLAAALLAVPYLWWTSGDAPPGVAAPVARAPADAAAEETRPGTLEPYALPPLERFAGVVERPLFSPTRRMPPIEEPPPEVEPTPEAPVAEAPPAGPEEPDLRFFGTVRQGGRAMALVTFPSTNEVARLAPGDQVGEWQVVEVGGDRLVLGIGEERREFEIFGPSSSAAPASVEVPAADAPPPEAVEGGPSSPEEQPYVEPSGEEPPMEEMPPE